MGKTGIRCPKCGTASEVMATREIKNNTEVVRRRQCPACGYRFTSRETYAPYSTRGRRVTDLPKK